MLPLRDHNPSGKVPVVTYFLIAINSALFFYMFSLSEPLLEKFVNSYALVPSLFIQGKQTWGIVVSMFLHGSWGHLFGNMLFLHIFGDNLEDALGSIKYFLFYLISGLGAALLQILLNPNSQIPMLGASGAIAGIMGGYLVLFPKHRVDILYSFGFFIRTASVPAYFMLIYWFVAQLFYGVGTLGVVDQGGVAYFAHIGGFITGWLLISILRYNSRAFDMRGDEDK